MRLIDANKMREDLVWCKSQSSRYDDYWDDVIERLDSQPTISGWVSVKDRVPEEDGSTLICTKNGRVCTARFYKHQGGWNAYAGKNAAYWMPLPEPPEEVKGDA